MSTPAVNPYEMSMEELAQLSAGVALPAPEPREGQPRDDKGRFVTQSEETEAAPEVVAAPEVEAEVEAPPTEEPEQFYHRETVDIGEGGAQVFTGIGASPEEAVTDCLRQVVEAQKHATRKIRELSAKTAPVVEVHTPSPDEEAALAQRLLSEPSAALEDFYQKRRAEERKREAEERQAAEQVAKKVDLEAKRFLSATPDFYECKKNATRIEGWLKLNGNLEPTFENFQAAYTDLAADGLLVPKPTETTAPGPRSSGLSTRRSAPPTPPAPTSKVRDAYKMPMEELAALIRSGAQI